MRFAFLAAVAIYAAVVAWGIAAVEAAEPGVLDRHQVNITALTGIFPRCGEVAVLRVTEDASLEAIGTFLAEE